MPCNIFNQTQAAQTRFVGQPVFLLVKMVTGVRHWIGNYQKSQGSSRGF